MSDDKPYGYSEYRRLPDGRMLAVMRLIGGRGRLVFCRPGEGFYHDAW